MENKILEILHSNQGKMKKAFIFTRLKEMGDPLKEPRR